MPRLPQTYPVKWYSLDSDTKKIPDVPEDEYNSFCASHGQALLAWSRVESAIFMSFMIGFSKDSRKSAAASWDAIDSFRGRLKMTSYTMQSRSPSYLKEWEKLEERCRKKSLKRNKLAHNELWFDHKEKKGKRFFLSRLRASGEEDKFLYKKEIDDLYQSFAKLSSDIFSTVLDTKTGSPKD